MPLQSLPNRPRFYLGDFYRTLPSENTYSTQSGGRSSSGGAGAKSSHEKRQKIWKGLKNALNLLERSSKVVPSLHSATSALMSCLEELEDASGNRDEYKELTLELEKTATFLTTNLKESQAYKSKTIRAIVDRASQAVQIEVQLIKKQRRDSLVNRVTREDNVIQSYRRIEGHFCRLQVELNAYIGSVAEQQSREALLMRLKPEEQADYESSEGVEIGRRTCTENTRQEVLTGLYAWSDDPDAQNVYWMTGMAGTGKTTIATSLATILASRDQLGASFFCNRSSARCSDAKNIFPTIAYQLAHYSVVFQTALCEALEGEPGLVGPGKKVQTQFKKLLQEPLLKVKEELRDNVVIVIDALDECSHSTTVKAVLDTLLQLSHGLPVKFFVTSRPEPMIREQLARDDKARRVFHLHEIEQSLVQKDIETYLIAELPSVPYDQIQQLVRRAEKLFIFAATAVRYIKTPFFDHAEQVDAILNTRSSSGLDFEGLDALYKTVLSKVLESDDLPRMRKEQMTIVLWTVVCAQEPISPQQLAALSGISSEHNVKALLSLLQSVLHFSEHTCIVSVFHASFLDFLFDQKRSGKFFCDRETHSALLARQCFEVMDTELRFNICGLPSSFEPDENIEDLEGHIAKNISPPLAYACRYWRDHLQYATTSRQLEDLLEEFLSHRLLFWMEVMNLKQWMAFGIEALLKLSQWLSEREAPPDLCKLANDAHIFATYFGASPVSISTPHIYVSALPLCCKTSSVYMHYWKRTRGLMKVSGPALNERATAALAVWKSESKVWSVAYSPDGAYIAIGGNDGSVTTRNAHDGKIMTEVPEAHTQRVTSLAFSPDGASIVSGGRDRSISIWHKPNSGGTTPIRTVTRGQKPATTSIGYSPTGSRFVSAIGRAIHIRDSSDGKVVVGPFRNECIVTSIAFSPDGKRVVSGLKDGSVSIWNAESGKLVVGPLDYHEDQVTSVDFSANGTEVVSGSVDQTICVQGSRRGDLLSDPIEGHLGAIMSVKFSPNGAYIASGSDDYTICVWNVSDGTLLSGPFKGHTGSVTSVMFSPSGAHFVSGSLDGSVRLWSVHSVARVDPPNRKSKSSRKHGRSDAQASHLKAARPCVITWGSSDFEDLLDTGELYEDGWVEGDEEELLFWLPPELHDDFPITHEASITNFRSTISVDYSGILLGDDWHECYLDS